ISGDVLLPISEINRLRRAIVQDLMRERGRPRRWSLECQAQGIERGIKRRNDSFPAAAVNPQLTVLVRNLAQLDAALRSGVNTLYCDFENPKKYHEALDQFRNSAFRTPHSALFVAPPRIFKMGEEWTLKQVRSCNADGYLVR